MSANLKTDSKAMQIVAWASSLMACAYFIWLYFQTSDAIKVFSNMFSDMGVELPLPTRFVIQSHYLLPVLLLGPGVLVVGKEAAMRDKKLSLATTFFAIVVVLFAVGWINSALYAPLRSLVEKLSK
jgi:hypothetical protein